jgi:L-asparaginase
VQPDGGVAVALTGADLLASVPPVYATDVVVEDISHGASWNFDLETMAAVGRRARDAIIDGAEGVVVTHGTDTVEETAWMADLVAGDVTDRGSIVFTASMRNAGAPDADGPGNLRDALALARSAEGRGCGALLCVNRGIHEARWVTKMDSHALDTFRSFGVRPFRRPPSGDAIEPAIAVIRSHGGMDGSIFEWQLERGARGVVIEGTGAGNVSGALVPAIERAQVPIVVTTRCRTGGVAPIYGGPGGGHTLTGLGVIGGHELNAGKARVALAVAMGVDPAIDAVRTWFEVLA